MKVSFDVQMLLESQKTGIGRLTEALIDEFETDQDIQATLHFFGFLNKDKDKIHTYRERGFHINNCRWLPRGIYLRAWKYLRLPYRWIFREECEVTQFFSYDVPPYAKGKKVVYVHDMAYKACPETVDEGVRKILERNMPNTCKWADCIITVSEFSKQEIIRYMNIDGDKVKVVPCGVDLNLYHRNYKKEEIDQVKEKYKIQGDYILYIGTLEPRKNIGRLIEAYSNLLLGGKDIPSLVLAGRKGWLNDEIFQKVKEKHLEHKVIFTGYIEREEAPKLLNGAMMFVFPSIYEGFGIPPLEAMACGTPVIVANAASLPEVVGDAGIKIDPLKSEELSKAMELLINDSELRKEYINQGLERAKKYTWRNSKDMLKNIYQMVVEHGDENESER